MIKKNHKNMKRFERILDEYCAEIGIPPDRLKKYDRHIEVDTARKAFWKVMHDKGLSEYFLARMFSRDVLSIRRGIARIKDYLKIKDKSSIYFVDMCEKVAKWE